MVYFCYFHGETVLHKVYAVLVKFRDVQKLQSFGLSDVILQMYRAFHRWFSLYLFIEKEPPIKFCGVCDHFSRTFEVAKFRMIQLYLDVSDEHNARMNTKNMLIVVNM